MTNRTKLSRFIDNSILTFIFTLFIFLLINKSIKNTYVSLSISLLFGFLFIKIISYFQFKKYRKLGIKKQELKDIENINTTLRKLTLTQQTIVLKKLFSQFNPKAENKFIRLDNNILIYNNLNQSELTVDTLFDIYSRVTKLKMNENEIAIICNSIPQNIQELKQKFNDINLSFITPEYFYALTKKYNYEMKINSSIAPKRNYKHIFTNIFLKKQSKYFIRCGFLLYITSFLVPFSRYYIITASICLIIGAFCLIFGSKETKTKESQLL